MVKRRAFRKKDTFRKRLFLQDLPLQEEIDEIYKRILLLKRDAKITNSKNKDEKMISNISKYHIHNYT